MSEADREVTVWGRRFTKREFFGKPGDLALGLLVLFGSPLLMLYAMDNFPVLDDSTRILWVVPLLVLIPSWGLSVIYRKRLFPWGNRAPALMWGATLAVAVLPTMLALGMALIINGALDRSTPIEHGAEVRGLWSRDHLVRVAARSFPGIQISVQLTRYQFYDVQIGDSLRLFVRSGALGVPWIERYSLR